MKGFLCEPLFWLRETLRWHWREVVGIVAVVWWVLGVTLALLST